MEDTKICFKCGRELPLSEFYKHPQMADGHLNKCKECTKKDVRDKYMENIQNADYIEKERARGREKYARLNYRQKKSENSKAKARKYTALRSARKRLKFQSDEYVELHHWNYNLKTQVIQLDKRLHKRVHALIQFDLDSGIYYKDGEPLDTLEKHLSVIKAVCERDGFDFSEVKVIEK